MRAIEQLQPEKCAGRFTKIPIKLPGSTRSRKPARNQRFKPPLERLGLRHAFEAARSDSHGANEIFPCGELSKIDLRRGRSGRSHDIDKFPVLRDLYMITDCPRIWTKSKCHIPPALQACRRNELGRGKQFFALQPAVGRSCCTEPCRQRCLRRSGIEIDRNGAFDDFRQRWRIWTIVPDSKYSTAHRRDGDWRAHPEAAAIVAQRGGTGFGSAALDHKIEIGPARQQVGPHACYPQPRVRRQRYLRAISQLQRQIAVFGRFYHGTFTQLRLQRDRVCSPVTTDRGMPGIGNYPCFEARIAQNAGRDDDHLADPKAIGVRQRIVALDSLVRIGRDKITPAQSHQRISLSDPVRDFVFCLR